MEVELPDRGGTGYTIERVAADDPDADVLRYRFTLNWQPPDGWVALITWPGHDPPMELVWPRVYLGASLVSVDRAAPGGIGTESWRRRRLR